MGALPARPLPDGVSIREAADGDVPALRAFRCSNAGEPWTVAPELTIRTAAPGWVQSDDAVVLVAVVGDEVIGVMALTPDLEDPSVMTSQTLGVVAAWRRQYVGYNLKLRAVERSSSDGVRFVASEVDEHNVAMRRCNDLFLASTAPEPHDPELLLSVVRIDV